MTSIRDAFGRSLGIGETFALEPSVEDGRLVAEHPNDGSPMDVIVLEGLDRLEERPPSNPIDVEIRGRVVDGRVVGRVVDAG